MGTRLRKSQSLWTRGARQKEKNPTSLKCQYHKFCADVAEYSITWLDNDRTNLACEYHAGLARESPDLGNKIKEIRSLPDDYVQ